MSPRLLVCCEFTQRVMTAFLEKGFDAYSNDIIECEGKYKDRHLKMDAHKAVMLKSWDLIIAHPPCTYLANVTSPLLKSKSGLNTERYLKLLDARDFFMWFWLQVKVPLCVENPLPHPLAALPPYTQIVDPTMFGDTWKKRTCFWLKDLPPLLPTTVKPLQTKSYHADMRGGHNRSKISPYLAQAMADQWAPLFI